jgi:hypothetical protein
MIGILWRILFMKRLFFVLLFALSALFFSACSSSDSGGNSSNEPAPQDIEGKVIIPSGYNTGYIAQVCGDANNSNSCDSGETTVSVNMGSGEFSVTTRSDYPLVAEFYPASATSGTSLSVLNGSLPALVYTTPAGETTLSAFTTMVKNKVDTQPGLYNVISGADKVKADTGITFDPFNAGSYTANAVVHNKVSAVTAGILEYICDTLDIAPNTFSAGVILALYNVVYDMVAGIIADPNSADVDDLIENKQGSIDDNAIAAADGTFGEVWNWNSAPNLYDFWVHWNTNYVVVSSGEDDDDAKQLPTNTLPSGDSLNLSDLAIKVATVASPTNITTSSRFSSKTFNLGAEAKVYTIIFTQDYTKSIQSAEYLQQNLGNIWGGAYDQTLFKGANMDNIDQNTFDGTFAVTTITKSDNAITFFPNRDTGSYPQDGTFVWEYDGKIEPFHNDYFPFTKQGSFVKTADGNKEAFKLTASDGSVAILFFHSEFDWVLATYPTIEGSHTFFNQAAAQAIIDQWKTDLSPRW